MSRKKALLTQRFLILMSVLALLMFICACNEEKSEDDGPPIFQGVDGDLLDASTDGDEDSGSVIPSPDGDSILSDADIDTITADGDDKEFEQAGGSYCQSEVYCPPGSHCDPDRHICLGECDPVYPDCPNRQVCKPIVSGESAGRGYGVCVLPYSGKNEGEDCSDGSFCAPSMVCGQSGRCELICAPQGFDNCEEGLECVHNSDLGFGSCAFCTAVDDCRLGETCDEGYCIPGGECAFSIDCELGEACFQGRCIEGCGSNIDCLPGICSFDDHYCYADICEEDCTANNLCCSRLSCGPCCSPSCEAWESCQYDPRCYPKLYCCVDASDCRERPPGYCGPVPCNPLTGACGGVCPSSCNWGYECGSWTDYECRPKPPLPCQLAGMDCEQDPCMICNGENLGEGGQCVATEDCGMNFLPEGFSCMPDPFFALECGWGLTCCKGSSGMYTCCPTDECRPGFGCIGGLEPDGDAEPYSCRECDLMLGEWTAQNIEACNPAPPWSSLLLDRDIIYDCYFLLYHDAMEWDYHLANLRNCDNQALWTSEGDVNHVECVLFWDNSSKNFVYNCESRDGPSCQVTYLKQ